MVFIVNLIVFILVLGIIILLHELGHFFVAKKIGVLVHEYAIGMGPALYQRKKGETTYSLRAIPIGGYVSLAGEDNNDALISVGDTVGLRLNNKNEVVGIVLDNNLERDVLGKVLSYEMFDPQEAGLFIELEDEAQEITRYQVLTDARYYYGKQKELQIAPKERSLNSKPKWQRFLVMFAGPFMNFVLAFFLFFLVAAIVGKPVNEALVKKTTAGGALEEITETNFTIESINNINVNTWDEMVIEVQKYPGQEMIVKIADQAPITINTRVDINLLGISNVGREEDQLVIGQTFGVAAKSKLASGDKIVKINDISVSTWEELVMVVTNQIESREISITYERYLELVDEPAKYEIIPAKTLKGQGIEPVQVLLGVERATKFNLGYAFGQGFVQIGTNTAQIFRVLGGLFTPKTSGISVSDLAGPIGIFNLVGQVRAGGFVAVISFMAFLSVNVALINLLPIPALDGGRIVMLGIEAVTRRPLNRKVETWMYNITFILLMVLFVFVMIFDILRLF